MLRFRGVAIVSEEVLPLEGDSYEIVGCMCSLTFECPISSVVLLSQSVTLRLQDSQSSHIARFTDKK